jgi:hypothetical protein
MKYSPDTGPEPVLFLAAAANSVSGCSTMPSRNIWIETTGDIRLKSR